MKWLASFCMGTDLALFVKPDLHCHSRYSDGVLEPAQLAVRAFERGVDLWALTDHDDVSGVREAREAASQLGVAFIAGVEISVTWAAQTVHIVGLGVDESHEDLASGLARIRAERDQRALLIAEKLALAGIEGSYAGALEYVQNPSLVSRTHFARFLHKAGYVNSLQAAFDRYLGEQGQAYVPTQWASLHDAVDWILASGGVAVVAHPGRYKFSDLEFDAFFHEFRRFGGCAIEVNTGSHRPLDNRHYAQVARDYGFLASCGSDFHGPQESRHDLGSLQALPADLTPVWQALDVG